VKFVLIQTLLGGGGGGGWEEVYELKLMLCKIEITYKELSRVI
jgi:hypothetical protein